MATFGDNPGDSKTSLLNSEAEQYVSVLAITWDDFINRCNPQNVSLIKIDVEGAEFDLIRTMSSYLKAETPAIFLSTHPPYLDPSERRTAMEKIVSTLSFYPNVYDEFLNPIDREQLLSVKACEEFGTYLFAFT